jgi:hypothetical protein
MERINKLKHRTTEITQAESGVVGHIYNPSTQEVEAGRCRVGASLGYRVKPCLNTHTHTHTHTHTPERKMTGKIFAESKGMTLTHLDWKRDKKDCRLKK